MLFILAYVRPARSPTRTPVYLLQPSGLLQSLGPEDGHGIARSDRLAVNQPVMIYKPFVPQSKEMIVFRLNQSECEMNTSNHETIVSFLPRKKHYHLYQ